MTDQICPVLTFPQEKELVRGDKNSQIETFVPIRSLIPLDRVHTLQLQAPGEQVGNLPHKKVAFGIAQNGDAEILTAEPGQGVVGVGTAQGKFRSRSEIATGFFDLRIQLREQACDNLQTGKGAPLAASVPYVMTQRV